MHATSLAYVVVGIVISSKCPWAKISWKCYIASTVSSPPPFIPPLLRPSSFLFAFSLAWINTFCSAHQDRYRCSKCMVSLGLWAHMSWWQRFRSWLALLAKAYSARNIVHQHHPPILYVEWWHALCTLINHTYTSLSSHSSSSPCQSIKFVTQASVIIYYYYMGPKMFIDAHRSVSLSVYSRNARAPSLNQMSLDHIRIYCIRMDRLADVHRHFSP